MKLLDTPLTWHNVAVAALKGQYFAMLERESKDHTLATAVSLLEKAVRVLDKGLCEKCMTPHAQLHFIRGRLLCDGCVRAEGGQVGGQAVVVT